MSKRRKTHPKQEQPEEPQAPESRIELATDTQPWCEIPVSHRHQADLPEWTGNRKERDSEKWLGQQIWPLQESKEACNGSTRDNNREVIGKGRLEICSCQNPGSVECVNCHVTEERNKLKSDEGEASKSLKINSRTSQKKSV